MDTDAQGTLTASYPTVDEALAAERAEMFFETLIKASLLFILPSIIFLLLDPVLDRITGSKAVDRAGGSADALIFLAPYALGVGILVLCVGLIGLLVS